MELGYLGPEGSYSYEAAKTYAHHAQLVSLKTFYEIVQGVEDGIIDEGVLPIENSTEGAVTSVMDGLLKTKKAKIVAELVLPIRHNLLSLNSSIEKIHVVYSHPQAIEQCREYIQGQLSHASIIPCESTSLACKKAKEGVENSASIANIGAASIYGLRVLQSNIQDNSSNQTRFVVISRKQPLLASPCKTSIAFTCLNDRPGTLYAVLKEFADRNINLTRIESRPAKAEIGKYVFYVDFIGLPTNADVSAALSSIDAITNFLIILGTYPIFRGKTN